MRKKRVMVIGARKSGKTTLVNALNDYQGSVRKTPDIIYGEKTIDVPSSYIENTWMNKHLVTLAQDATHVLLLIDQEKAENPYSPGFAKIFNCPVIGVITKSDLEAENQDLCYRYLNTLGVPEPYYMISDSHKPTIDQLKEKLFLK